MTLTRFCLISHLRSRNNLSRFRYEIICFWQKSEITCTLYFHVEIPLFLTVSEKKIMFHTFPTNSTSLIRYYFIYRMKTYMYIDVGMNTHQVANLVLLLMFKFYNIESAAMGFFQRNGSVTLSLTYFELRPEDNNTRLYFHGMPNSKFWKRNPRSIRGTLSNPVFIIVRLLYWNKKEE